EPPQTVGLEGFRISSRERADRRTKPRLDFRDSPPAWSETKKGPLSGERAFAGRDRSDGVARATVRARSLRERGVDARDVAALGRIDIGGEGLGLRRDGRGQGLEIGELGQRVGAAGLERLRVLALRLGRGD